MYNSNKININQDNKANNVHLNNAPWFERQSMSDNVNLTSQYVTLCKRHHQQKKWVLFINPDESSIEALASIHKIDTSQVLMVNFNKSYKNIDMQLAVKKNIASIKSTLSKGNCSAVILSGTNFDEDEICELAFSAQQGQTKCVILEKHHSLH